MKKRSRAVTEFLEHGIVESRFGEKVLSEGRKGKDEAGHNPIVSLKNDAGTMDLSMARSLQIHLSILLERNPDHFNALIMVIEGRSKEVPKETLRILKQNWFIDKSGVPLDNIKRILQASLRRVDDGMTIVNPVDFKDGTEVEIAEVIEKKGQEEGQKHLDRLIEKLFREKGKEAGNQQS